MDKAPHAERNHLVILVAHMANLLGWKAGVGTHKHLESQTWNPEWAHVVRIDLPTGQINWHIHESQVYLLEGLPRYEGDWDGACTEEKYLRVEAAFAEFARIHSTKR